MNNKLKRILSATLVACMLLSIVPLNATSSTNTMSLTDEDLESDGEAKEIIKNESSEFLTEDSDAEQMEDTTNETDKSQSTINTSETVITEENTDEIDGSSNWEINLALYDSSVDNGATELTEIHWNASDDSYSSRYTRYIIAQITYRNSKSDKTYAPGELQISIPNLAYNVNNQQISAITTVGANYGDNTGFDWDLSNIDGSVNDVETFVFTNKKEFEENANFEGTIRIAYALTSLRDDPETYENECIHEFESILKAELKDITESNTASFSYTRTYIHPWKKRPVYVTKSAHKVESWKNMPENGNEYIWVKYGFEHTESFYNYSDSSQYPYINVANNTGYYKENFDDGCIVVNEDGKKYEMEEDGSYHIKASGYKEYLDYIYVGYPKSIYSEENGNLEITNKVELWGRYFNSNEAEFLSSDEIALNLADYVFTYYGNLYGIEKTELDDDMIAQDIRLCDGEGQSSTRFEIKPYAKYTGTPMTLKIGDDVLFATTNNGVEKLEEDEYYFSTINFNTAQLVNGDGEIIPSDKYDIELYIRYRGTDEYIKYENARNKLYYSHYKYDPYVVGFYYLIKGIDEELNPKSDNKYGLVAPTVTFCKEDIPDYGTLYNFCYLQVFTEDINGNLILRNEPGIDSYANMITKDDIATYDKETYGTYMQRDVASNIWKPVSINTPKVYVSTSKQALTYSINMDEETYNGSFDISATAETDSWYNERYKDSYKSNISTSYAINQFTMYDLLPAGMELASTKKEILASATTNATSFYDLEFNKLTSSQIKELTNYNVDITYNWNGTGRTMIVLKTIFKQPVFIYRNGTTTPEFSSKFNIKYKIPFDSVLEYGNVFNNYVYLDYTSGNGNGISGRGSHVKDNGELDSDAVDINSNGITSELFPFDDEGIRISDVLSTHQDVTKYIQTDKTGFTTGTVKASPGSNYQYKLRARSGSNSITNLIIYDSIEEYIYNQQSDTYNPAYGNNEHWNGNFVGIDTSYAESKGYIVKTYYSEDPKAGELYDENGNRNNTYKEFGVDSENIYENGNVETVSSPNWPEKYPANMKEQFNYWKVVGAGADYLELKFDDDCKLEKDDGIKLYDEKDNNITAKVFGINTDYISGTDMAGKTVVVPGKTVKIAMYSDDVLQYKGFSVNITPKILKETIYQEDLSKVKTLAFEFLDNNGNPAIINENSSVYVIIKMKAIEESTETFAYNGYRTQWNAIGSDGNIVPQITGMSSNITKVSTNQYFNIPVEKIWDDNNNEYGTRPEHIDIILKKYGEEIDRKTLTTPNTSVIFENLLLEDIDFYEIEESSDYNYKSSIILDDTGKYTITNTLKEGVLFDIHGNKKWRGDTENKRPTSVTINLIRDGEIFRQTIATAENGWKYEFKNVPKFDSNGNEIKYDIKEVPVENYNTSYENGKYWLQVKFDANFRTENVSYDYVEIYYKDEDDYYKLGRWGGTSLANKSITIPSEDFWLYWRTDSSSCNYYGFKVSEISIIDILDNKPTATKASIPNYQVEEINGTIYPESPHSPYLNNTNKIWHYTSKQNTENIDKIDYSEDFNIINTYKLQTIGGIKTWKGDSESKRPENITIHLMRNGIEYTSTTTNAEKEWKYTFEDVPIEDENGNKYEYTIVEDDVENYTTTYSGSGLSLNVSNTYLLKDVSGKKTWINDDETKRPESITIWLLRDGEKYQSKVITATDNWQYTFEDVPIYKDESNSVKSVYSIIEEPVEKYIAKYSGLNITNEYNRNDILGQKYWYNDDESTRPNSIVIYLYQNGELISETTTDASKEWKYEFKDMPIYDDNYKKYTYTIGEEEIEDYRRSEQGVIINFGYCYDYKYNSFKQNTIEIIFRKDGKLYHINGLYDENGKKLIEPEHWSSNAQASWDNIRPSMMKNQSVYVPTNDFYIYVHADYQSSATVTIDSVIPAYQLPQNRIKQSVNPYSTYEIYNGSISSPKELSGKNYPECKFSQSSSSSGQTYLAHYTFSDSYDIANFYNYCNIKGQKKWLYDKEEDRPENIIVNLIQNGEKISSCITTSENEWEYLFEHMPLFDENNNEYVYTVQEEPLDNYKPIYNDAFDITNEYQLKEITIEKSWENDDEISRPNYIKVTLYQDGKDVRQTILTKENNWKHKFRNLPIWRQDGTEYEYTCQEEKINGYVPIYTNGLAVTFDKDTYIYSDAKIEIYYEINRNIYKLGEYTKYQLTRQTVYIPSKNFYIYVESPFHSKTYMTTGFGIKTIEHQNVENNGEPSELPTADSITTKYGNNYPKLEPNSRRVSQIWRYDAQDDGIHIKNVYNSQTLSGKKKWYNGEEHIPDYIKVYLLQNGKKFDEITTNAEKNWEYEFNNIPIYAENGIKYEYTLEEEPIDGFVPEYTYKTNGIKITFNPDTRNNSGDYWQVFYKLDGKIYSAGKYQGYSPYAGGYTTEDSAPRYYKNICYVPTNDFYIYWYSAASSSNSRWGLLIDSIENWDVGEDETKYHFSSTLPYYSGTITELYEDSYPRAPYEDHYGYTTNVKQMWHYTIDEQEAFDITNKYIVKQIDGQKIWVDNENSIRPNEILIDLYQDGILYKTTTTNELQDWKYIFTDCAVYNENMIEHNYKVKERPVSGWQAEYESNLNGMEITFDSNFSMPSSNTEFMLILYKQDDELYKLNISTRGTALAGETISIPSKEFYIYLSTNGQSMYSTFKVTSIKDARVETVNSSKYSLSTKDIVELTGSQYPSYNGYVSSWTRRAYHYTKEEDKELYGPVDITNRWVGKPSVNLILKKTIDATNDQFDIMAINKFDNFNFSIELRNIETENVVQAIVNNKCELQINNIEPGTYEIKELNDIWYINDDMKIIEQVDGIELNNVDNKWFLIIDDNINNSTTVEIGIINKLKEERYYDMKYDAINLFDLTD